MIMINIEMFNQVTFATNWYLLSSTLTRGTVQSMLCLSFMYFVFSKGLVSFRDISSD